MTMFGNFNHDFPLLAKQSGFYFQLHKDKVNWAEIENLNLSDITENRNFQLLEQNLSNVINCNLEEYDLKLLDQNFVKIFKLAQLGVNYLAYCETYLDKCVIILQEQLIAFQEEFDSLKYGKEKRKETMAKNKRKTKTSSYQCEKCDKAFISDVYLKFHDKRRHGSPNTLKHVDVSPKRCFSNDKNKSSTSTQTTFLNDSATITDNNEGIGEVKIQHAEKIEKLEQEIQDLKERLKKAENVLTENNESVKPSEHHPPFTAPMCLNTMLLLLPSHKPQSGSSCHEVISGNFLSDPGILQPNSLQTPQSTVDAKTEMTKTQTHDDNCLLNDKVEKYSNEKEKDLLEEKDKLDTAMANAESVVETKRETKKYLECDKENLDPNGGENAVKLNKPLPPPRKLKKATSMRPHPEPRENTKEEQFVTPRRVSESDPEGFTNQPVLVKCTPLTSETIVKNKSAVSDRLGENLSEINEDSASNKSFQSNEDSLVQGRSRSFFKAILQKNSPNFRMFGRNLRKSLTNLYDSVSSTGKDPKNESVEESVKSVMEDGLNNHLRQLGIDPEWSGIPKKTMKQKLKALKHRRKFLAKENPMYPIIRQQIKEKVIQKLKTNLETKKSNLVKKLGNESTSADDSVVAEDSRKHEDKTESVQLQNCVMYDIESESESNTSDSEVNVENEQNGSPNAETEPKMVETEKEFDFSVFQVGRGSFYKKTEQNNSVKEEELLTDSDTEDDFLDKKFNCFLSNARRDENGDDERHSFTKENQSILKGTDSFQSKPELNAKKVWFVNRSNNNTEEALSDSSVENDNLWPLKDNWERQKIQANAV